MTKPLKIRTHNIEATLNQLYVSKGIVYRVVSEREVKEKVNERETVTWIEIEVMPE